MCQPIPKVFSLRIDFALQCSVMRYLKTDRMPPCAVFVESHILNPITPSSSAIRKVVHWKLINKFLNIIRNHLIARDGRNLGGHFSILTTNFANRFPTFYRIGMTCKHLCGMPRRHNEHTDATVRKKKQGKQKAENDSIGTHQAQQYVWPEVPGETMKLARVNFFTQES